MHDQFAKNYSYGKYNELNNKISFCCDVIAISNN